MDAEGPLLFSSLLFSSLLFSSLLFSSLLFSSLLFSSIILCSLGLSSCTGNGGAAYSEGGVYNPDGTPASSGGQGNAGGTITGGSAGNSASGTSGATASGSQTISAEQLHSLANSGRADSITKLFPSGEDESAKTFFLNLSPEDFGVPAGGYMVLAIESDGFPPSYGSRWENTQLASEEDGLLHFVDIPMVRVGSHVTVTVLCYTADGMLISSGYSSGVATENGVPMQIGIIGSAVIAFGPNGTESGNTTEHDGMLYDIIGYSGTSLDMAAVNTNSGSTMEVKINGTVVGTTTEQSFTKTLDDGYNAIEVTVTKGSNEPIVVTRNVYVVKEFIAPVITMSGATPNGKTASSGGKTYTVIEYEGTLPTVTVTNGYTGTAIYEAKLGTSIIDTACPGSQTVSLAEGFNAVTATLTESVCGTLTEAKYYYVVKKLVVPVIARSGGTENGNTVTSGGKSYQVIEYDTTLPTVTVTNSYNSTASYEAKLGTTVIASSCPETKTVLLTEGFNAVTATLSKDYCDTLSAEKYYYVVKKLTEPTVEYSDGILTNETAVGGFHPLRYSWLADPIVMPKFSVTNNYDGDEAATMTVKLDSSTLTGASGTGNITDQALTDGNHTITITLSSPYHSEDLVVTKKIKVAMKAVKVQCGQFRGWYTNLDSDVWPGIIQQVYIKGINASSAGEYPGEDGSQKTALNITKTHPKKNGVENAHEHHVATDTASNYVYLTDPASTFRFWTNQCEDDNVWNGSYGPGWLGYVPSDYAGAAKTLAALKTLLQGSGYSGQVFDIGDFNEAGQITTDSSRKRSHYQLDLSLTDATYTAGTDDE